MTDEHIERSELELFVQNRYCKMRMDALDRLICTKIDAVCCRQDNMDDDLDRRFDGIEKDTLRALTVLDERFAKANEIREMAKDQAAMFVTRDEVKADVNRLDQDIKDLRDFKIRMQATASQKSLNLTTGIAVGSLLIGIISTILSIVL